MKLIINGDDFGITHACNIAIIDCFRYGLMKSASMMTNMPYAQEASRLWKEEPRLSVGIHFCLSAGRPITDGKTLIKEDGTFDKTIFRDPMKADPGEIEKELQAQFDRFVELTGRYPDHINSHHGIEAISTGSRMLQEYSRKYQLPIRQFLNKDALDEEHYQVDFEIPTLKMMVRDGGKSPFRPEDVIRCFSQEELESNKIFELAGHPGYVDYDLLQLSSLTVGRIYDAHTFCCTQLTDWVREHNVQLITYKEIPLKGAEEDKGRKI